MIKIAVANPDQIPGGMKTVRFAVEQIIPEAEFSIIGAKIRKPPKKPLLRVQSVYQRASKLSKQAIEKVPDANIGVGFYLGNELNTYSKTPFVETVYIACCQGKSGLPFSSEGSNKGRRARVSVKEIKETFAGMIKWQLTKLYKEQSLAAAS